MHRAPRRVPRAIVTVSASATVVAVIWAAAVLLLPDAVGARILGATWPQAKPLLPLFMVAIVAVASSLGAVQGMLALGAAKRSLFTQVVGFGVQLPSMVGAAAVAGARGAALASGLSEGVRTLVAWVAVSTGAGGAPASSIPVTSEQPMIETVAN